MTKMNRLPAKVFVTALLATVVTACGPGRRGAMVSGFAAADKDTTTGAVNDQGLPYTAYTTTDNIKAVKAEVEDTQGNEDFGAQILSATIVPDPSHPQQVEVDLQWKDIESPLVFKGSLSQQGGNYYATLLETTGQRSDLTMTAACTEQHCDHANFLVFDESNHKAAIIVSKEDRLIKTKKPAVPSLLPSSPEDDKISSQFAQGQPVVVTSVQIIPGHSYFSIRQKTVGNAQPSLDISGDLVEPDGNCTNLQVNDPSQNVGHACLLGNDEEGDLILRVTPSNGKEQKINNAPPMPPPAQKPQGPKSPAPAPVPAPQPQQEPPAVQPSIPQDQTPPVYLELLPREPSQDSGGGSPETPPSVNVPNPNCPVNVNPQAGPMVQKIMADCGNPIVVKDIKKIWASEDSRYSRRRELVDFLTVAEESRGANPSGRPKMFRQMLDVFDASNDPEVLAFITLQESDFGQFAAPRTNSHGELGFFQFLPQTAIMLGLQINPKHPSLDERTNIVKSSRAFVSYFNDLLGCWDGDFKMALASYNRGEGKMLNAAEKGAKKLCLNDPRIPEGERESYALFKDFWKVYQYNSLRSSGWDYVPSILAAIFTGVSPETYGVTGVRGMEMK